MAPGVWIVCAVLRLLAFAAFWIAGKLAKYGLFWRVFALV